MPPDAVTWEVRIRNLRGAVPRHPLFPEQEEVQRGRSTDELLHYDPDDPISGVPFQLGVPEEETLGWQGVMITGGHHRLAELYRRYQVGLLTGEETVRIGEETVRIVYRRH